MKKRLPVVIVAVVVATAAVLLIGRMRQAPENRLVTSGNIELNEVNIAFKTAGRLIERAVDEGDDVKKGQVLARLDREQLKAQRDRDTAALEVSMSQLKQSETAVEWQKATVAADVEARHADLQGARAKLT